MNDRESKPRPCSPIPGDPFPWEPEPTPVSESGDPAPGATRSPANSGDLSSFDLGGGD